MKLLVVLAASLLFLSVQASTQEIDCEITFTNKEQLPAEARENLTDFIAQVKQYVNAYRWTKENLDTQKIRCSIDISLVGSPRDNHYTAQAFIGSQRPIYKTGRNTAIVRILDDKWEFDYTRYQSLSHNEYGFDPLLSFIDFYMYVILGYDFDSYKAGDGTSYFQKAFDVVNRARGTAGAGKGWEPSQQGTYSRAQLIEELLNPKFQDLREAIYKYHYKGLDLLHKDEVKARKNIFSALEKVGKLRNKINQPSLCIKLFFDTKYLEIAETFLRDPDLTIFSRLSKIDPAHQKSYDEYSAKPR
ncbi:MAG: DUF4835 family protein [Ignavibacteria bacterium]|nr:DUF4835 family protein [Ignavibacteria bacterium]MBI3765796.1 DUF4835 family protein [Ignavibacteriales bacterium]